MTAAQKAGMGYWNGSKLNWRAYPTTYPRPMGRCNSFIALSIREAELVTQVMQACADCQLEARPVTWLD